MVGSAPGTPQGMKAEDIQGQGRWTIKRVQNGTPLSTLSALAYVVEEHGQGKGCLNLPPLTITAGSSGVELGGKTLSGTGSLGMPGECQPRTSHH